MQAKTPHDGWRQQTFKAKLGPAGNWSFEPDLLPSILQCSILFWLFASRLAKDSMSNLGRTDQRIILRSKLRCVYAFPKNKLAKLGSQGARYSPSGCLGSHDRFRFLTQAKMTTLYFGTAGAAEPGMDAALQRRRVLQAVVPPMDLCLCFPEKPAKSQLL